MTEEKPLFYWKGKPEPELTREELLGVIKHLERDIYKLRHMKLYIYDQEMAHNNRKAVMESLGFFEEEE